MRVLRRPATSVLLRGAALLTTGAAMLVLVGCSGADPAGPTTGPGTGTPGAGTAASGTAPSVRTVAWAGRVCRDTTAVKTSVTGLASAAAAGVASGDAKQQVEAQAATVRSALQSLAGTVTAPPAGQDDALTAELQDATSALSGSGEQLTSSLSQLQSADGALDTASALAAVAAASRAALDDLQQTLDAVGRTLGDSSSTLGQAFDRAPACQALRAAAS